MFRGLFFAEISKRPEWRFEPATLGLTAHHHTHYFNLVVAGGDKFIESRFGEGGLKQTSEDSEV